MPWVCGVKLRGWLFKIGRCLGVCWVLVCVCVWGLGVPVCLVFVWVCECGAGGAGCQGKAKPPKPEGLGGLLCVGFYSVMCSSTV